MPEPASHLLSSRPWGAPGSTESCHPEARYGMKSLWAKYHQISLHITIQYGLVYLKNQYPSLSAHLKNTHIISYSFHIYVYAIVCVLPCRYQIYTSHFFYYYLLCQSLKPRGTDRRCTPAQPEIQSEFEKPNNEQQRQEQREALLPNLRYNRNLKNQTMNSNRKSKERNSKSRQETGSFRAKKWKFFFCEEVGEVTRSVGGVFSRSAPSWNPTHHLAKSQLKS